MKTWLQWLLAIGLGAQAYFNYETQVTTQQIQEGYQEVQFRIKIQKFRADVLEYQQSYLVDYLIKKGIIK